MSQPVKLSDSLVLDARLAGEAVERSIAGQVEFWAKLGRSVEVLLGTPQILALCQQGARPLSECLRSVDSPEGRERLRAYLRQGPYPHYEADPDRAGVLIRIDEDGTRTRGRFVKRRFVPVGQRSARR